jgi:catechol 2,3-dioxygenase-like lactoylglutathione lyase family enzyme
MLGIKAIDHVTVPIRDLDVAQHFYCDVLGARLLERFDAALFLRYRPGRECELDGPNSPLHLSIELGSGPRLDLFLQQDGQPAIPRANPHIAFEVEGEDLDPAMAYLESAGVAVAGPTRLGPPGQASVYFFDPFGNKLELMTNAYPREIPIGPPDWIALAKAAGGCTS